VRHVIGIARPTTGTLRVRLVGDRRGAATLRLAGALLLVAEALLAVTVILPALMLALIPPAALACARSVPQLPAIASEAITLAPEVGDADPEGSTAEEARDLVKVDRIHARHVPRWRVSTTGVASARLSASRRKASRPLR